MHVFSRSAGELTRELISAPTTVQLGDPGLLAGRLNFAREATRSVIGIVPHYVDQHDARIVNWRRHDGESVKVISLDHMFQMLRASR